jgi:sugar lactone lactonase YvrE
LGVTNNGADAIAIDGAGNAWVTIAAGAGSARVAEMTSAGVALSPNVGFSGGGLAYPVGIAIDSAGNVWVANSNQDGNANNSVTEIIGAAVPVKTPLIGPPSSPP